MKQTPRYYQTDLKSRIRDAFRSGSRAPLVVLPTGGGKTFVFSDVAESVARNGKHVNILTHRDCILRQLIKLLSDMGLDFGVIAPGHTMTGDLIQASSVYTLVKRLHRIQVPDLIIVDECHHTPANTWRKIIASLPNTRLLGVTATPCRLDGKGLGVSAGGFFDKLIIGPDVTTLTQQGFLAPYVFYKPRVGVDMSGVQKIAGDYIVQETAARVDKPVITGDVIQHYTRLCPNAPAVAFCANVLHAEHVAEQFNAAGYAAASIDGKLPRNIIESRLKDLASGTLKIITSCNLISEGFDLPNCVAGIGLRPTCSLSLHLQMWGRILRPFPGKSHAIYLDHVGNYFRHGQPSDPRAWSLSGRQESGNESENMLRVKFCARCYAAMPVGAMACPQCGTPVIVSTQELEQIEGELVKFEAEQAIQVQKKHQRAEYWTLVKAYEDGQITAAELRDGMLEIAKHRGYKPYWGIIRTNMIIGKRKKGAAA